MYLKIRGIPSLPNHQNFKKNSNIMHKIFSIVFTLVFCYTNSNADTEKFVINSSKEVSDLKLRDMKDAWEIIRIDYPRARPVFMYSCNNVDFCLFDLNKDNKFVIFNSPSSPQVVKFTVDGVDQPKAIQKCFMKLSPGGASNTDSVRLFGGIFELEEENTCELQIGSDINSGKYLVRNRAKIT